MVKLHNESEKIDKSDVENDSIWMQVSLRDFGFKCMMNKHDLYHYPKCVCLCHRKKAN